MINKRIIINNVDVSGCEFLRNCIIPDNYGCKIDDSLCCDVGNCYYKQLKRKEQEYEELRQYHNKCCEENAKKLEEWLEKFNQVSRDFFNGKFCNEEHCNMLKTKGQVIEIIRQLVELTIECPLTIAQKNVTSKILEVIKEVQNAV